MQSLPWGRVTCAGSMCQNDVIRAFHKEKSALQCLKRDFTTSAVKSEASRVSLLVRDHVTRCHVVS